MDKKAAISAALESAQPEHLLAVVLDASTGATLDGVPTPVLYQAGRFGDPVFAYHREGEWVHVGNALPSTLEWHARHGHDVKQVRVVLPTSEQLEACRG